MHEISRAIRDIDRIAVIGLASVSKSAMHEVAYSQSDSDVTGTARFLRSEVGEPMFLAKPFLDTINLAFSSSREMAEEYFLSALTCRGKGSRQVATTHIGVGGQFLREVLVAYLLGLHVLGMR